ncbi:MAG: phage integrase N-terminal SAM-like domain-containing protein, partial [Patescibacteria group bacterium]
MNSYLLKTENELKLRNYSPKTIKGYLSCLKDFLSAYKNPQKVDMEFIKNYLLGKINRGFSPQTVNLYLNSIKYFYRDVLKNYTKIDIKLSKRSLKLPIVLSREEIGKIISNVSNLKHKLLISLSYGAGLRVSEVINLKIKDININELTIHIKEAKGNKDRITIFP